MPANKPDLLEQSKKQKLTETVETLTALQFGPKQRNEIAAYTLLAMLDLRPEIPWAEAQAPLRGITPIIDFVADAPDTPRRKAGENSAGLRHRAKIFSPRLPRLVA